MSPQAIAEIYATEVLSGFDFYKPDFLEKLFRRFGDQGMSYFQLLRMMGFETPTGRDTYGHFEENRTHEVFHVGAAGITAGSPGDSQTVTLEGIDLDANNKFYPRLNNTVVFPNEVTGTIVDVDISTPTAPVLTIEPNQLADTIPTMAAGDPIVINSMQWAEGTGQPASALKGTFLYENDAQIIKESITVNSSGIALRSAMKTHLIAGNSQVDNQQPSSIGEGSTTIPKGSTLKRVETVGILKMDGDIVSSSRQLLAA